MAQRRRWADLDPRGRVAVVLAGAVQLGLLGTAWADLARRDASEVNGPRWAWALVCLVNFFGPIAYFVKGRKRVAGR